MVAVDLNNLVLYVLNSNGIEEGWKLIGSCERTIQDFSPALNKRYAVLNWVWNLG
jgi:hypothetical protein